MVETDPDRLVKHVLIPVASEDDGRVARETILQYIEAGGVATVVHVVKQAEGSVDPSPASVQEDDAERLFEIVRQDTDGIVVETRTAYGTDIVEVADEMDASACSPHRNATASSGP